jgi:NADH-quinone oxidoreductase subunit E
MQPSAAPPENLRLREACAVRALGREVRFSAEGSAELERLFTRYPTKQAVVLPALWIAQREFGWISKEAIEYVAGLCEVPPAHVYSVVSFYTMFHRAPKGKWHLQLCTNLSCQLLGAEHLLECLREKLGIGLNETTADGLFSLEEVECLAACELAPVLQVNDEFHGPVPPEMVEGLLAELRRRQPETPWK